MKKIILYSFALISTSGNALADDDYDLFNPVPDDKLRPFTTERPSKTDSVFTVDSGHVVVETSLFSHTNDDGNSIDSYANSFLNSTNIRLGLTQSSDLQVIFNAYTDIDTHNRTDETKNRMQGYGDTYVRLKYNIIGNDGGNFGAAVIPFIKFPTSDDNLGNSDYEGGVAVPLNYNLPDNWSVSGESIYNVLKSQDSSGYYGGYSNSVVLGKSIGDWSGYTEFYTYLADTDERRWQDTLDFGIVYAVNNHFHIDTGVNFGVTEAAPDVNYFVGLAYRF